MNPYIVLGINRDATKQEIDFAFKRLSEKYNPQTYAGDTEFAKKRLNDIVEAYNILSDPKKKSKYDQNFNEHVSSHKTSSDSYNSYYNRPPKTSAHIHDDYDIATKKYNNFTKNDMYDEDYLDDPIQDYYSKDNDLNDNYSNKMNIGTFFSILFFLIVVGVFIIAITSFNYLLMI